MSESKWVTFTSIINYVESIKSVAERLSDIEMALAGMLAHVKHEM